MTVHGDLVLSTCVTLRLDELAINSSLPLSSLCGLITDLKEIVREDKCEHEFRRERNAA